MRILFVLNVIFPFHEQIIILQLIILLNNYSGEDARYAKAAAFSFYNKGSRIRKLIHNLKYKGIKEIGYELGKIYGLIS